ncbi:MAG TPA: Rieske (2Fe-2S) protein [Bacteroidia bacterium]|nr:Rieske (2Fe-2S) protein [Bacteroidia bacterium]
MQTRRQFLKAGCGLCLALPGIGIAASLLQGCASVPVVKASPSENKISVAVSSFGKSNYVLVRSAKLDNDILLVKKSDGTFTALLMQCTHQEQPLTVSGNTINCSAHGSMFDLDGNVTHAPATRALTKYIAAQEGEQVIIHLS